MAYLSSLLFSIFELTDKKFLSCILSVTELCLVPTFQCFSCSKHLKVQYFNINYAISLHIWNGTLNKQKCFNLVQNLFISNSKKLFKNCRAFLKRIVIVTIDSVAANGFLDNSASLRPSILALMHEMNVPLILYRRKNKYIV